MKLRDEILDLIEDAAMGEIETAFFMGARWAHGARFVYPPNEEVLEIMRREAKEFAYQRVQGSER